MRLRVIVLEGWRADLGLRISVFAFGFELLILFLDSGWKLAVQVRPENKILFVITFLIFARPSSLQKFDSNLGLRAKFKKCA